jgi:hypothetical protein
MKPAERKIMTVWSLSTIMAKTYCDVILSCEFTQIFLFHT